MSNKNVQQLFDRACRAYPEKTAVEQGADSVSYRELNARARRIAERLVATGFRRKALVAVMIDAGTDYVATVLGILKAGHAFMPISLGFPARRVAQILDKAAPELAVVAATDRDKLTAIEEHSGHCFTEAEETAGKAGQVARSELHLYRMQGRSRDGMCRASGATADKRTLEDACYVMTTSGSTGDPKVILGSHAGLWHFVSWEIARFGLDSSLRCSLLSHTTFDVSLRDIFVPLSCGGAICVPDDSLKGSPYDLLNWLEGSCVTHIHIVPTMLRMLMSVTTPTNGQALRLRSLEHALIAGEPLYGNDVLNWRSRINTTTKLVNVYGPSETTLAKLYYEIDDSAISPEQMIPIGRPIWDTEIMIVNDHYQLCTAGEIGEIYINTPYRSLGYLNDSQEEGLRFVRSPLAEGDDSVVYRTGDLGQYTEDGLVMYVGRADDQVKLFGNRVELNEVEAVLRTHPQVRQAAAAVKPDSSGMPRLIGYVVSDGDAPVFWMELKRFVGQRLPAYMVPALYVALEEMPLTHSNKIDRKRLPEPERERPALESEYAAATSKTERCLARLWIQILDLQTVGIDDNFFDVGGTSVRATLLIVGIKNELAVDIAVTELYQYPTIRKLGALIDNLHTVTDAALADGVASDRAQKRKAFILRRRAGRNIA